LSQGRSDRHDEEGVVGQGQRKGQVGAKATDRGLGAQEVAEGKEGGVKEGEGEEEVEDSDAGTDGEVYVDDSLWALLRTFKAIQRWEETAAFKAGVGMLAGATRLANKTIEAAMFGVLAVFVSILVAGLLQAAKEDRGFLPS